MYREHLKSNNQNTNNPIQGWTKDRQFSKEDNQMPISTWKYIQQSVIIREIHIKTAMIYYFILFRMATVFLFFLFFSFFLAEEARDLSRVSSIFLFLCLFKTVAMAYGCSQTRHQIRASASGLCHSRSNSGSKLHLHPTPQLMTMPYP